MYGRDLSRSAPSRSSRVVDVVEPRNAHVYVEVLPESQHHLLAVELLKPIPTSERSERRLRSNRGRAGGGLSLLSCFASLRSAHLHVIGAGV